MAPKPKGTVAFWARGTEIMENDQSHIRVIMNHPDKFGVTDAYIKDTYARFGEKLGIEGKARAEIIQEATRAGWIRVRHYVDRGADYWSIQVDSLSSRLPDVLFFVRWALEHAYMSPQDELVLTATDDETQITYPFIDGGVRKFLAETEPTL